MGARVVSRVLELAAVLALGAAAPRARADDWPQWRGPRRDGVWRESGIVEALPRDLEVRWRAPIGGGYAGPAVAAGRVYVTDRALDAGESNPDDPFDRSAVGGRERILCLDARDGEVLWKHEWPARYEISYPSGPRATPTIAGGRVFALGAMGDLIALDAASGEVLWAKNFVADFGAEINVWGASAAPLVDGRKLVVLAGGRPGGCVLALDRDSGKELWRALDQPDPGYCPPVIVEAGGARQLIVWTPQELVSLDPERGTVFWRQAFALQSALSVPTPIFDADSHRLFVTAFYDGPLMMELDREKPAARLLWKGKSKSERETDGLHAILCTPAFSGEHLYGVCSYGQLRCLEAATGKRVWESLAATGSDRWWNAFLVRHEDRFFIANEQGELIIAKLSPEGYEERSRARLIEPTLPVRRRKVVWSHPAFAERAVFARNDREILCASLAASGGAKR